MADNVLIKVPHRRPPIREASFPPSHIVGQPYERPTRVYYGGTSNIPGRGPGFQGVHKLYRPYPELKPNRPTAREYRFKQFGDKWREVDRVGNPVDPEDTIYLNPADPIKGWGGIVVENIDPEMGSVKYRQYDMESIPWYERPERQRQIKEAAEKNKNSVGARGAAYKRARDLGLSTSPHMRRSRYGTGYKYVPKVRTHEMKYPLLDEDRMEKLNADADKANFLLRTAEEGYAEYIRKLQAEAEFPITAEEK